MAIGLGAKYRPASTRAKTLRYFLASVLADRPGFLIELKCQLAHDRYWKVAIGS